MSRAQTQQGFSRFPTRGKRQVVIALLSLLTVLSGFSAGSPAQTPAQKKVLVLYSVRAGAPLHLITEEVVLRELVGGFAPTLDYYAEYIDVVRFPDPNYQLALRDFLKHKYQRDSFDLVMTVAAAAMDFAEKYHAELFSNAPVVFIGRGTTPLDELRQHFECTGVREKVAFRPTVEMARKLQPDLRRIFVLSGNSGWDRGYEAPLREQLRGMENPPELVYMNDRPFDDVIQAISHMPSQSMAYYIVYTEDVTGRKFLAQESLQKFAAVANAPLYVWFGGHMTDGVTGGVVLDMKGIALQGTTLAARVLRGEKAGSIPPEEADASLQVFDWRQLKRWGLKESVLPPGTSILNRQASFWEQYRNRIIAVIALVVLQTSLIAFLLIERNRRKQASERLFSEKLFSDTTIDSLPGIFYHYDHHGRFIRWNRNLERVTGYSPEEISRMSPVSLFAGDDARKIEKLVSDVFNNGEGMAQINLSTRTGESIPYFFTGRRVYFEGQPFLIGTGIDIAERLEAETALQQLTARLLQLQDEERRRIARELHDVTAQNLFAITLNLSRLQSGFQHSDDVKGLLAECYTLGKESQKEIRTFSYLLHPPMLDEAGLVLALQWYVDGFSKRSGIDVDLFVTPEMERLPFPVEIALFRIVQESLTNIHRHSGSETASIRLEQWPHEAVLRIVDSGRGINHSFVVSEVSDSPVLGVGILGMRQRLIQLGGTLEITSDESGTFITATVPLSNNGEAS